MPVKLIGKFTFLLPAPFLRPEPNGKQNLLALLFQDTFQIIRYKFDVDSIQANQSESVLRKIEVIH